MEQAIIINRTISLVPGQAPAPVIRWIDGSEARSQHYAIRRDTTSNPIIREINADAYEANERLRAHLAR